MDVKLFSVYRLLAFLVGVLLAFCSFVALPLRYLPAQGSSLQRLGETLSIGWVAHGWAFMAYVVVAFLLSRRARWSIQFTVLALIAGLVPLLIFWVEHKVNQRVRAENPELVAPSPA
jgi:integral membrane protein